MNRAGLAMVGLDNLEQARAHAGRGSSSSRRISRESCTSSCRRCSNGHGEIEVRFRHFKTGDARWMAYKVLAMTGRCRTAGGALRRGPGRSGSSRGHRRTGGGPVRGGSPEERIPGDAGARAAQPPAEQRRWRAMRLAGCETTQRSQTAIRNAGAPDQQMSRLVTTCST